ncbi:MAG: NAD(P)-dependent oxidoreductase [Fibrobacteres bacterium]|jgi:3-hydroxyisobutyrate dehydrogenase-like beta-hydroxyacid dehydrogenase|nr:NAD(P)-dependent oxidoreductase [Fibrobacterota bacterium]
MNVAVLGLGIIGAVWARNLQQDGLPVRVWNRTKKDFPGWCDTPEAAAAGSDLIIIVVSDPPAVQDVLRRILPALKAGQIVMQSSTISPTWTLEFAKQVKATGADFLEAPFTGSKIAAEQRKTVFYMGGDAAVIARARPVVERQAAKIQHVGELGKGSAIKLAMNMNIALVMEALSESHRFALSQGLTDDIFFEALSGNVSRSGVSDLKEPKLRSRDFAAQFSLKHMDKDLRLAEADAKGLRLPLLQALREFYREGMERGLGDSDFSVLDSLLGPG